MPQAQQGVNITDSAQINPDIIVADDIAPDAVGASELADDAVASANIIDGIIVNADINASAAIVDTKLATIATAGKVSGAALTLLASIPAGAGVIPTANLPAISGLEELGDVTLGAAASSIAVTVAARQFLKIILLSVAGVGGVTDVSLRFNSDAAGNYAWTFSDDNAAAATEVNSVKLRIRNDFFTGIAVFDVMNLAATIKRVTGQLTTGGAVGTVPVKTELGGLWNNTADQITTVTFLDPGGNNVFAANTRLIVLGSLTT